MAKRKEDEMKTNSSLQSNHAIPAALPASEFSTQVLASYGSDVDRRVRVARRIESRGQMRLMCDFNVEIRSKALFRPLRTICVTIAAQSLATLPTFHSVSGGGGTTSIPLGEIYRPALVSRGAPSCPTAYACMTGATTCK